VWLFSESPGFLLEVEPGAAEEVEAALAAAGVDADRVGGVTEDGRLTVRERARVILSVAHEDLRSGWSRTIAGAFVG
jgi:selenophosphate synthetase-related protein